MSPNDEIREEEQIVFLLSALAKGAPPPDQDVLAKLRAQATAAFQEASSQAPSRVERKRRMNFSLVRWLGAAAAVLLGVTLYFWQPAGPAGVALGQVLENSEQADSLHVHFQRADDGKLELWHTRMPERSRWDDLGGNYRIVDGGRQWLVREKSNEARRVKPADGTEQPLYHLLNMAGLSLKDARLLETLPARANVKGMSISWYTAPTSLVPRVKFRSRHWFSPRRAACTPCASSTRGAASWCRTASSRSSLTTNR